MKYLTINYWRRKIFWRLFPEKRYWYNVKKYYKRVFGTRPSYLHPRCLNEKLLWLSRYWRDPIKTRCADKYAVRQYVSEQGLGKLLIPLIDVYDFAEQIDFSKLPSTFVLKCTHGSGCNIICTDKKKLNIHDCLSKLKYWESLDYSEMMWELHYKDIPHRIICEQLLSLDAPIEVQFWCLNGEPESILACRKNFDGSYDAISYSLNWNRLFDRIDEPENDIFPKPLRLKDMIEYARKLSNPFPFVRVDLFCVDDKIYFAELTFTPAGNFIHTYKSSFQERLGGKLVLPKIKKNEHLIYMGKGGIYSKVSRIVHNSIAILDVNGWIAVRRFVKQMNNQSANIGLSDTYWINPTRFKYHIKYSLSTAHDLALLKGESMKYELISQILV